MYLKRNQEKCPISAFESFEIPLVPHRLIHISLETPALCSMFVALTCRYHRPHPYSRLPRPMGAWNVGSFSSKKELVL